MITSQRILVVGGLALLLWSMSYGLWYAVFDEHQTLEGMGANLAQGFVAAAERDQAKSQEHIARYAAIKYEYVREVDVHSHWGGLAMVLLVLAFLFDRVALAEAARIRLAWALLLGSALFPAGVILQTVISGPVPRALAAIGAALVTLALAVVAIKLAPDSQTANSSEV
jgi:uncharacterized membrane protein